MPRDANGYPFGIDSVVQPLDGALPFTVVGMLVSRTRMGMRAVRNAIDIDYQYRFYRWHQVRVVDPSKDPYSRHHEHTDKCIVDLRQVNEGASNVTAQNSYDDGDKIVWGT